MSIIINLYAINKLLNLCGFLFQNKIENHLIEETNIEFD